MGESTKKLAPKKPFRFFRKTNCKR